MNKIGVSQKAVILNKQGEFLTIRRTKTAPYRPNTWDLPGGDLEFGEEAQKSIIREIKEETGLKVRDLKPFDVHSTINKDKDFWVTIGYKATAVSSKVALSFEHDQFKWVTTKGFLKLKSAPKLRRFAKNLKK